VFSDHAGPTNWIASGKLSAKPQGRTNAGRPARLAAGMSESKPVLTVSFGVLRGAEPGAAGGGESGWEPAACFLDSFRPKNWKTRSPSRFSYARAFVGEEL
jgi:hypothetical protein